MFDWSGLKGNRYFLLKQVPDPLKYCNYSIPIPLAIGLPFMPCDLPNEYVLSKSDQKFETDGDIYLSFEEQVNLLHRVLIPASHRPWTITGKDYYHHNPYVGIRDFNCCLNKYDRPQIRVYYNDKYVGKILQRTIFNCCCITQKFQEFQIYNQHQELIYKVVSKNPQRSHLFIFPWWGFDKIYYSIMRFQQISQELDQLGQRNGDTYNLMEGQKVGQIVHLFNGCSQYSSKNDKYGIQFPQDSNQEQRCLLVYCTLFIDYLLFQNF